MDLNDVKDIAIVATPFTTAIINAFIKPQLDSIANSLKTTRAKIEHSFTDKFNDYLIRSYERQAYIKTLVFQNNKKLLHDLYIPLSLTNTNTEETIKINSYPKQLLPTYGKILIVDTAGMGKSTLSKYLFLKTIEEEQGIPIFVELRQLRSGINILDLIHNDLSRIDEIFNKELLISLIEQGNFIFFFDGFDEIPLKEREFATQHIQDFIAKVSKNKFLITSRQDPALASFADFQRFVIKPLRESEAYNLLEKYDPYNTTSTALIEKLKLERHRGSLKSFLSNPLLVSLLFKAYDFKPTLPLRADVFYRQVYEALFENHDLAKGGAFIREKHSKLNIDDFARVLRVLSMRTVGLGKVEYTSDELLVYIKEAKERCSGLTFSNSDFIKDLISTVPLFVQDGLDYRWSHKSFQEYFAALFIANDAKGDADIFLQRLVDSKEQLRFLNVLELHYDIDTSTFHRALSKRLITEFIDYINGPCYNNKYPGVDKEDVLNRKLICFDRKYILFSSDAINHLAGEDVKFEPMKAQNCMRQYIESNGYLEDNERIGSSTRYPAGSGLVAIHKPNIMVMEILHRKGHKMVVDMRSKAYRNNPRYHGDISAGQFIKDKQPLEITQSVDNILNSLQNFDRLTYLLIDNERTRISLDADTCKQTYAEIESLSLRNNITDFLTGI